MVPNKVVGSDTPGAVQVCADCYDMGYTASVTCRVRTNKSTFNTRLAFSGKKMVVLACKILHKIDETSKGF